MTNLIFGYTWEQIDRAQRGGGLDRAIAKHQENPTATQSDEDMLAEHGKDGLMSMGYFGAIDRLQTSGKL